MKFAKATEIRYRKHYLDIKRNRNSQDAQSSLRVVVVLDLGGDEEGADAGKKVGKHQKSGTPPYRPVDPRGVRMKERPEEVRRVFEGGEITQGGLPRPTFRDMREGNRCIMEAAHTAWPWRMR